MKSLLVILSGSSGVGKNTIINQILNRDGDYALFPTYTTRSPRYGESQGNPYFFVSKAEFEEMLASNELYEHQIVHENYYGVSKRKLHEMSRTGKILIKDIDVLGTLNLLKAIESDADMPVEILTFFYTVGSKETLEERLRGRGEKQIELRLARYDMEQTLIPEYDYIIENSDMNLTISKTMAIVAAERKSHILPALNEGTRTDAGNPAPNSSIINLPVKITVLDDGVFVSSGYDAYLNAVNAGRRIAKAVV